MPLNSYILNGPSTVIEEDLRDPWVSWQNHLNRTNQERGGVDLVAQSPQPVYAPTPGRMHHWPNDGGAGNSCRFEHDLNPGWRDVFSHLSSYVGYDGQHFNQGEIIAYTGDTGDVDPHLHRHLLNPAGARQNPWDYFSGGSGNPGTPGGITISIEDGKTIQRVAKKGGYNGVEDGVPGTNTWLGVQTLLTNKGFYSGPIDGAPGTNTWKGLQALAALGGYAGPQDGVPGPNTYNGLNVWLANGDAPAGMSGVYGFDVGTTQRNLDFQAMRNAGYQFAIVKAGGSNVPIYVAPHYQQQVAKARAAGLVVGHYWMAGSSTPVNDANFFVDHLFDYRPGDLLALDNEAIDSSLFWNDSMTASFMQTVKNRLGKAPFLYTYSSMLTSNTWTQTKAVGSKLWIAHYTETPGNPNIGTAFPAWEIHQYTQSGNQNGIDLVLDVAKLSAFAGLTQPPLGVTAPPATAIPGGGSSGGQVTLTTAQGIVLQNLAGRGGYTGPVDGDPGTNTWIGAQTILSNLGYYSGPIDGDPGTNTYKGLQLLAYDNGYSGPIDGIPGTNTFNAIQAYLDRTSGGAGAVTIAQGTTLQKIARAGGYAGTVDGVPGTNTWKGIQQIAAGYGYSGPVDGAMGTNSWAALQRLAAKGGYAGVADGVMGTNSWKGVQTVLVGFGYSGPIDGAMGTNSYKALQRMAAIGGYHGPIDGVMGTNSWKGIQTLLSGVGYTGPLDGDPGTNTYKGLQTLAFRGGYSGPIDGIPGENTYDSLQNLLV